MKLVREERETAAVRRVVREWPERVTSIVGGIELSRAAVRADDVNVSRKAAAVLDGVELVGLDREVARAAATVPPAELRSLDAIHLATALTLGAAVGGFVSYDLRLAAAAERAGLALVVPS